MQTNNYFPSRVPEGQWPSVVLRAQPRARHAVSIQDTLGGCFGWGREGKDTYTTCNAIWLSVPMWFWTKSWEQSALPEWKEQERSVWDTQRPREDPGSPRTRGSLCAPLAFIFVCRLSQVFFPHFTLCGSWTFVSVSFLFMTTEQPIVQFCSDSQCCLKSVTSTTSPLEFPSGSLCGSELWVWPVSEHGVAVSWMDRFSDGLILDWSPGQSVVYPEGVQFVGTLKWTMMAIGRERTQL